MTRTLCFRALALTFLTVPAVALMALPAYGQASDAPPGNNGTIKIDDVPIDDGNENVPHPGCTFVVDFFGYDVGTRTASLVFDGQEPTGGGELLVDTFTFDVESRESGNQLNASRTVDLSEALAGIEPHPQQGWHVKLTVHVDGSQGSDVKHKVFWVSECAVAAPAAPDEVTPTVAEVAEVVDAEVANVQAWNAAVWSNAMAANAAAAAQPEAAVLSSVASAPAAASAPAGTLPRTGPGTTWAFTLGVLSLLAGSGFLLAGRRAAGVVS